MEYIDTHKIYKDYKVAGLTDEQADTSVASLMAVLNNFPTKADFNQKFDKLENIMVQGFEILRKEIEASRKEFKTEMDLFKIEVKSDMRNARLWENFKFALLQIEMFIVMGAWALPSLQKWFPL